MSKENALKNKGPKIKKKKNFKQDFFPRAIIEIYICSLFSISKVCTNLNATKLKPCACSFASKSS